MLNNFVTLTLMLLSMRSVKAQSCLETPCYNEGDCIDGMCVCPIGFHKPLCQECSSIANCDVKNCTNERDHVCLKCEGDHGRDGAAYLPNPDATVCIEQCSWRDGKACFPGTCDDVGSCSCYDGFSGNTCLETYLQPDLYDFVGFLTDGQSNITTSSDAQQITFTNEHFPKQFTVSWTSEFDRPNVDLPPYVLRWYFGIASVEAQIVLGSGGSITEQVAQPTCSSPVSRDFPMRRHECEETVHLSLEDHQIKTGDIIRATVRISAGGNRVIINRDAEDESRETYRTDYFQNRGRRVVDYLTFTFDLDDPYHCITSYECQSTMLHLESDVTTENYILVGWSDWVDVTSGIGEFVLRLYRIEIQGSTLTEMKEESELKFTAQSETQVGLLLPDPGLYSLILEVGDRAMNIKLARRFVLFDNMNPPQIRIENPIVVHSASGDDIDWLTVIEHVNIQLDWGSRFWSRFVHENSLLNEIDEYVGVNVEYDQVTGTRGRSSVNNVMGIIRFEIISTIIREDSIINRQYLNVHLNITHEFTYSTDEIQNGDELVFLVRAWDIFNRSVEDSKSIKVESTAPQIIDSSVIQNGRSLNPTGNVEVHSHDMLSVQVSVEEHESRLTQIAWKLTTRHVLSTDPVEIDKETITADEYCAAEPMFCDVKNGTFNSLIYNLPLDFSQVHSQDGQQYSVEIKFSNEAQLTNKAEFQFLVTSTPIYLPTVKEYSTPMMSVTDKSSKTTDDVAINSNQSSSTSAIGGGIGGALLILIIVLIVVVLVRRQRKKRNNDEFDNIYDMPNTLVVQMNNNMSTGACATNEKNTNVVYDNHIQRVRLNPYDNRLALTNTYDCIKEPLKCAAADTLVDYEEPMEDTIEFPRENLQIGDQIGEGAFGNVMRARAFGIREQKKWTVVAVKNLKDVNKKPDFTRELQMLRKLSPHPNLVTLLGICSHEDPFYLIFEYASHGDLKSFLQAQQSTPGEGGISLSGLTPRDMITFANGIAKGMAFLASKKVIHRDLAARNVLVGEDANGMKICKISDFGLSREILTKAQHRQSIHAGGLPVRWMAYESIFEGVYTSMSDIWSFGVVIWEIVTLGARPYSEMTSRQVLTNLQAGNRLEKPSHCSDYLYNVMLDCWNEHPRKRPTFNELVEKLDPDLESIVLQFDIFDSRRYSCYNSNVNKSSNISAKSGEGYYEDMNY